MPTDSLLARNWKKSKVLMCHNTKERFGLVCFLRERYSERFFEPIDCLLEAPGNDKGFGFAIMSLCCLLIETLQCYRLGWPSSSRTDISEWAKLPQNQDVPESYYRLDATDTFSSAIVFERFFQEPMNAHYFQAIDGTEFYEAIRCGLLHQAQTKSAWRIVTWGKLWDKSAEQKTINRDEFARQLKDCFEAFLQDLETASWDDMIWKNTRKKIWWLAQTS